MNIFKPSIGALFITGLLMLSIFVLVASNYKSLMNLEVYRKLNIITLIAIAAGVHGLLHLGLEVNYGFNPYYFNWFE